MTYHVIKDAENAVLRLRQYRFTVQEHPYELAERALKYGDVFDDSELTRIFVEGLTDAFAGMSSTIRKPTDQ